MKEAKRGRVQYGPEKCNLIPFALAAGRGLQAPTEMFDDRSSLENPDYGLASPPDIRCRPPTDGRYFKVVWTLARACCALSSATSLRSASI